MNAPANPEGRRRWGWGLRLAAVLYAVFLAALVVMAVLKP